MERPEDHEGLVKILARRASRSRRCSGIELEDFQQVARLKLVELCEKFDPDNGNTFASYAIPSIIRDLNRYADAECSRKNITPRWPGVRVKTKLKRSERMTPAIADRLVCDCDHESVDEAELVRWVQIMLDQVDARDAQMIRDYHGLESGKPMTYKEVGEKHGMHKQVVSNRVRKALAKIKEMAGCQ